MSRPSENAAVGGRRLTVETEHLVVIERDGKLYYRHHDLPEGQVTGACISLTSRCNENCVMCMEPRVHGENWDLPWEETEALIDAVAGRVPYVHSSASEALLYPRFLDYARAITDRGSKVGVVTNGLALSRPEYLADCIEAGLRSVMVSTHTADPETFGRLTQAPKAFPKFLQALDNLDAHQATASEETFLDVTCEIVVMRPLIAELDSVCEMILERLPRSRPSIRIESFRAMNHALDHLELQPTMGELAEVVSRLLEKWSDRLDLGFRFVPLCLLPGAEHLAGEVSQVLQRKKVVGNLRSHAGGWWEVMRPANALEHAEWESTCRQCSLALVCPGVFDIPVEEGCAHPRPVDLTLEALAARAAPQLSAEEIEQTATVLARERDPLLRPAELGSEAGPEESSGETDPDAGPAEGGPPKGPLGCIAIRAGEDERFSGTFLTEEELLLHYPDPETEGGQGRIHVELAREGRNHYCRTERFFLSYGESLTPRTKALLAELLEEIDALAEPVGPPAEEAPAAPEPSPPAQTPSLQPARTLEEISPAERRAAGRLADVQLIDGPFLADVMGVADGPMLMDYGDDPITWEQRPEPFDGHQLLDFVLDRLRSPHTSSEHPLGLYLHVPFCQHICGFCRCYRFTLDGGRDLLEQYTRYLIDQIDFYGPHLSEFPASFYSLGGGTPSLLSPEQIDRVLGRLNERLTIRPGFPMSTFEMTITTMNDARLQVLADHGVPRVSAGVQTLTPRVRKSNQMFPLEAGRLAERVASAKARGLEVNLDLIIGLAGESAEEYLAGFRTLLDLHPASLVTGVLSTDYFKQVQTSDLLRQVEKARAFLGQVGEGMARMAEAEGYVLYAHSALAEGFAFLSPEYDARMKPHQEVLRRFTAGIRAVDVGTNIFAFGTICNLAFTPSSLLACVEQNYDFDPKTIRYHFAHREAFGVLYPEGESPGPECGGARSKPDPVEQQRDAS